MNFIKIYEKVNLTLPLEQRRFFSYYADSVTELIAMYGKDIFKKSGVFEFVEGVDQLPNSANRNSAYEKDGKMFGYTDGWTELKGEYYITRDDGEGDVYLPPQRLEEICIVLPLYHDAIVNNILFLAGQDETQKSEFIRKAESAHNNYWSSKSKGRHIKRMRW